MSPEQALKRIKKCLALAQSSEPHEAAAAIRQAQALMEKYGLDQAAVEMSDITETRLKSTGTKIQDWEANLASMVASSLGIRAMAIAGRAAKISRDNRLLKTRAEVIFVGTAHKVKIAEYMFQSLARQMRKARALVAARRLTTAEILLFNTGWLYAVEPKVKAFAQPVDERIDAYIEKLGEVREHDYGKKVKKAIANGTKGLTAGYRAGQEAELYQAMEKASSTADAIGMSGVGA